MPNVHPRDVVVAGSNSYRAAVPLGDWQLARAFARLGHRVLYVDPVRSAIHRRSADRWLERGADNAIDVLTPHGLHGRVSGALTGPQNRWVTSQTRAVVRELGYVDPILITVRPERGLWRGVTAGPLVYWQKDMEWASLAGHHERRVADARRTYRRYRRLLAAADVVVAVSGRLVGEAGLHGVDATHVPNGCDVGQYERRWAEPEELAVIARPRVVFSGSWGWRVDRDLVDRLARAFPDVSFVLLGPVKAAAPAAPNVHALGPRSYVEIPAYLQHCDVGLVPYRAVPFNAASCPLKIYEYLGAGLPSVVAGVDSVAVDPEIVRVTAGASAMISALRVLLDTADELRPLARAEAERNSWDDRARRVLALAQAPRGPREPGQLRASR